MTAHDSHQFDFKYIGLLLVTAVSVGFVLGTLTLLGPLRWTVAWLRGRGFGGGAETTAVATYIFVLLFITLIASSVIVTYFVSEAPRWKRFLLALATLSLVAVTNFFWSSPTMMKRTMGAEEQLAMFTFGPYPDEAKLVELKERGFTAVISLLHPAVVPFEPQLLREERAAASRVGIRFIHAPMLPWVSDNRESVATVRKLAGEKENRYYVHCYLGMDRVMIVKQIVEQESGSTTALITDKRHAPLERRSFERGPVVKVSDRLYVGPYPTPEELLKIVGARVDNIVSLVDTSEPEHKVRQEQARRAFAPYKLAHTSFALTTAPFDAESILETAAKVRGMTGVTFVHEFYGPGSGRAPLAAGFIVAYRTGRAPVMPLIAAVPLQRGAMKLLDVDVVIGPRPNEREFNARLVESGVRLFVCMGGPSAKCSADEKVCERDRLQLVTAASEGELEEIFRGTGPFYVYSPNAATPGEDVARIAAARAAAMSELSVPGQ